MITNALVQARQLYEDTDGVTKSKNICDIVFFVIH